MEEIQHVAIDMHAPAGVLEGKKSGITRVGGADVASDRLHNFMKEKLDEVLGEPLNPRPVSIFRLQAWSHEINKDLCEPKMVSIGPYHHGKESLRAMEEHKWSTLRDFLARNRNVGFEIYLREMRLLEAKVRECYSETVNLESNAFVMMLLLDGCFILELLLKSKTKQWDTLCFISWVECDLITDLCLLENQMPFFVIHKLLVIQDGCSGNCRSHCPLLELINSTRPWPHMLFQFKPPKISCSKIYHLLDLYYKGALSEILLEREEGLQIFPSSQIVSNSSNHSSESSEQIFIPCITELHEAGVKFRRKSNPRDMFDISFHNGTMEMPCIQLDNNVKIFLWNMVAFEQTQPHGPERILLSYLGILDQLINTGKDISLLERSGVLENFLQNDEEVAKFFNQLGEIMELTYNHHYFYNLCKDVKRYSDSSWHKHRAKLMHDYFSSPWSSISVVAASILLILTAIQTYYSASK